MKIKSVIFELNDGTVIALEWEDVCSMHTMLNQLFEEKKENPHNPFTDPSPFGPYEITCKNKLGD